MLFQQAGRFGQKPQRQTAHCGQCPVWDSFFFSLCRCYRNFGLNLSFRITFLRGLRTDIGFFPRIRFDFRRHFFFGHWSGFGHRLGCVEDLRFHGWLIADLRKQRKRAVIRTARIICPFTAGEIIHQILPAQLFFAQILQKHVEDLAGSHIRKTEHQMFGTIGGDCDPRIYFSIQQGILKFHLFFPARTQKMGLIGILAFFRKKNRLADSVLPQNNGAIADLEASDVIFSGDGERDSAVEFLFFFIMLLCEVVFHLHERAVHDPTKFDPLIRLFLFSIEDADQKRVQDGHLKAECVHRTLSPEVGEFCAATTIAYNHCRSR